jgi:ATP-dependent Clp protease ATP-binding subunit ClpX
MIPELIGRLPIIATLNQLSEEDLARILTEPRDALTRQYDVLFRYDGARLNFDDDAIREIARRAKARGTGARALRSIMESLMLDIMYDLPERQPGQTYTISEPVVRGETPLFGPEGT